MKKSWLLRTASSLLCLLAITATMSACNTPAEGNDTATSDTTTTVPEVKTVQIAIDQYTLIRPDLCAQATVDAAVSLNQAVTEKTGTRFKGFTDDFVKNESEIDPNAYEILVGDTNRPESAEAIKDVSFGFVIKKIGNKIVTLPF